MQHDGVAGDGHPADLVRARAPEAASTAAATDDTPSRARSRSRASPPSAANDTRVSTSAPCMCCGLRSDASAIGASVGESDEPRRDRGRPQVHCQARAGRPRRPKARSRDGGRRRREAATSASPATSARHASRQPSAEKARARGSRARGRRAARERRRRARGSDRRCRGRRRVRRTARPRRSARRRASRPLARETRSPDGSESQLRQGVPPPIAAGPGRPRPSVSRHVVAAHRDGASAPFVAPACDR